MRIEKRKLNRRARILLASGCFCLAIGSGMSAFVHHQPGPVANWFDGVRGLLLGLAIGLNLSALLAGRRKCAADADGAAQ
jgi:hypothetical protein